MVAKDVLPLGDAYVLRSVAQGLCLLSGTIWLLLNFNLNYLLRYWPVVGYCISLILSALLSINQVFVLLQVLSILSIFVFFVSYYENAIKYSAKDDCLLNTTKIVYAFVMLFSILLLIVYPSYVYTVFEFEIAKPETRFHGLFPKPSMMGAAAGALIGIVLFKENAKWINIGYVICASICLFLTISRTFWLSLVFAIFATAFIFFEKKRKKVVAVLTVLLIICGSIMFFYRGTHREILREESLMNFSGRTEIWKQAIKGFLDNPFFGYGLTAGSEGLFDYRSSLFRKSSEARQISRQTLHNGYVQSLMDTGLIGTLFYLLIMSVSLYRIIKFKSKMQKPVEFFLITFLMIANIGESVIYAASVFHSILFWGAAISAMSLSGKASEHLRKKEVF
jgi:O-antigen ligase